MTLSEFFFDIPIYSSITIDASNTEVFNQIMGGNATIDFVGYNPIDKFESTFKVVTNLYQYGTAFYRNGGFQTVRIKCKRTDVEFWFFIYWEPEQSELTKVGQYPSVADFHLGEIKQYKSLLPSERLKEFTRAIGLAANGVGIGSFVYLRRIFEHLIMEAYTLALSDGAVSESDFQKARMDNKIDLLHLYLPTFLVENRGLYSILSLGIHELNEKVCLAHFDTLRVGIEIILDEKLEEFKKKEKIESAKRKLADLKGNINK